MSQRDRQETFIGGKRASGSEQVSGRGLRAESLTLAFGGRVGRAGRQVVLREVNLQVLPGQIVGLMGPSGAGKTTIGRVLTGRLRPDAGCVLVDGAALSGALKDAQGVWRDVAYVGQSPREACNAGWTLRRIIGEPYRIAARDRRGSDAGGRSREAEIVSQVASSVLLDDELLDRLPSEVSDGQLQRAVIARALVQRPKYIVCDEPVSMLDPITTAAVISALRMAAHGVEGLDVGQSEQQSERQDEQQSEQQDEQQGVGVVLISHDHRLLAAVADRVLELRDGALHTVDPTSLV